MTEMEADLLSSSRRSSSPSSMRNDVGRGMAHLTSVSVDDQFTLHRTTYVAATKS